MPLASSALCLLRLYAHDMTRYYSLIGIETCCTLICFANRVLHNSICFAVWVLWLKSLAEKLKNSDVQGSNPYSRARIQCWYGLIAITKAAVFTVSGAAACCIDQSDIRASGKMVTEQQYGAVTAAARQCV